MSIVKTFYIGLMTWEGAYQENTMRIGNLNVRVEERNTKVKSYDTSLVNTSASPKT